MHPDAEAGALQAIREEAEKLLGYELQQELREELRSISRLATATGQAGAARWDEIVEVAERLLEYDALNRVDDGIKLIHALAQYPLRRSF